MGGYGSGWILYKLFLFVAGSWVFSVIFWLTYHKMNGCCGNKKKKK